MKKFGLIREGNRFRIGIFLDETIYPISEWFSSYREAEKEINEACSQLKGILEKIKGFFKEELSSEMSPERIWKILSDIEDEEEFIRRFNSLEEKKRREVADFVFTKCSAFSGKAAIFSMRYNTETALLE